MAQMQKQRELKAAGISLARPIKIRGINYNVEIPFEKKVPEGLYEAKSETLITDAAKQNIALQQIETRRRDEEEKKKRALDAKKMSQLKKKNLPKAMELINKGETMLQTMSKLMLPAPQIGDAELNTIKKYASGDGLANAIGESSAAARALAGNYSQRDILQTPAMQ